MNLNGFMRKIFRIDGFFLVGEGIKDLVICMLVIFKLLEYIDFIILNIPYLLFVYCIGIMLVPVYYTEKWLNKIFIEGRV